MGTLFQNYFVNPEISRIFAKNSKMSNTLYSIGHSNQTQEEFLALIMVHDINCIVDVRSVPASKYSPQFNQEYLRSFLLSNNVQYLHFGKEFGARRTDSIDENGQVNFELAAKTPDFMSGVLRILRGMERGYNIAFMCSEADPLECHRFALVSRYFHETGVNVQHILKDAKLATHESLEKEMIKTYLHSRKYHVPEVDLMFGSYTEEDQRRDAYRLKNKEIGYKQQNELIEID